MDAGELSRMRIRVSLRDEGGSFGGGELVFAWRCGEREGPGERREFLMGEALELLEFSEGRFGEAITRIVTEGSQEAYLLFAVPPGEPGRRERVAELGACLESFARSRGLLGARAFAAGGGPGEGLGIPDPQERARMWEAARAGRLAAEEARSLDRAAGGPKGAAPAPGRRL